jgi:hypothetical protein
LDSNCRIYPHYGGRGIKLCSQWCEEGGFEQFLSDVGRKPSPQHSLDRIDNNSGYQPGNVRWATKKEQMRNMRSNRMFTLDGCTLTLVEWCEKAAIPYKRAHTRLCLGWSPRDAIFGKQHAQASPAT